MNFRYLLYHSFIPISIQTSSPSSAKSIIYPLILSAGIIDTLLWSTDSVAPISILLTSFFLIIVLIFSWCLDRSSLIYSKFGVNLLWSVMIAFFIYARIYCSLINLVGSIFTIYGIHFFKISPKCIA